MDRKNRDEYAELLRHFATGQMTNDDYVERADKIGFKDDAVNEIYKEIWFTYCDIVTHKLKEGYALTDKGKKVVARYILFLYSDFPFEWPVPTFISGLMNILTLGFYDRLRYKP